MAGQCRENQVDHNDETFAIAYGIHPSMFTVRLHYGGKFSANPTMKYEGGKMQIFDYCDADTFEMNSIDSWAFKVGLKYGDFALCVYKVSEFDGFNGLRPLKSRKNLIQFLNVSNEQKFIDVYFVGSGQGLDDLNTPDGNLRISETSAKIFRDRETTRSVSVGGDDCGVHDKENDDGEDEEEDVQLDVEDLEYGKEGDFFDDGELGVDKTMSDVFLEQIEVEVVQHNDEDCVSGESEKEEIKDDDQTEKRNREHMIRGSEKQILDDGGQTIEDHMQKKYRGPYARHGLQFKKRKQSGWVDSSSENSDDALHDNVVNSDLDSGISTSDSEVDNESRDVLTLNAYRKKRRYVRFNEKNMKNPSLFPGLVFSNSAQFKAVMTWYAAVKKKDIWFTCNERHRFGARCQFPCDWNVWLSRDKKLNDTDLVIKTISRKHKNCGPARNRALIKSTWLAKVFEDWFRLIPDMSLSVLKIGVEKKFGLQIIGNQARRTKEKALKAIEGDHDVQYGLIWDYIDELKKTHPGSTVFAEYEEDIEPRFKRIYVGLKPLIDGFMAGCRKLIGLDGCHTKGVHKQQILTAVAIDPNNGWWPICWAVVEKENKDTWSWFLKTLIQDIKIVDQDDYVIMSDKQKGLESAIHELLPDVEHRNCVQHIYRNFKKHHGNQLLREKLWACAKASNQFRFEAAMLALKETDEAAHKWLGTNGGKPEHWCRAFFSLSVKSDMLCNNLSESFNAFILSARDKPIITMLERIRRLCMERIKDRRLAISAKSGPLCPRIKKILDKLLTLSEGFTYSWNGLDGFEVFCGGEQHIIDLRKRECNCRMWQLTGIPCVHAIPALFRKKQLPQDWVGWCYRVDTFRLVYENVLQPIHDPSEWTKSNKVQLQPPKYTKQAGRPKLSRKRDITEVQKVKGKDRLRKWNKQTCKYCGVEGHNVRTCFKKKADHEGNGSQPTTQTRKLSKKELLEKLERVQRERDAYEHMMFDEMNNNIEEEASSRAAVFKVQLSQKRIRKN